MKNKKEITQHILKEINYLSNKYGFTTLNGADQIRNDPTDRIVAYGQFEALVSLYEDINNCVIQISTI